MRFTRKSQGRHGKLTATSHISREFEHGNMGLGNSMGSPYWVQGVLGGSPEKIPGRLLGLKIPTANV